MTKTITKDGLFISIQECMKAKLNPRASVKIEKIDQSKHGKLLALWHILLTYHSEQTGNARLERLLRNKQI